MVIGNNGVVNKAQNSKNVYSIAEVEELANIEYSALKINDYVGVTNTVTIVDVVNKLKEKYEIKEIPNEDSVTNMSLSRSELSIGKKSNATVDVIFESETNEYYVLVNGEYHKMEINNGRVSIGKEGNKENEISSLSVTSNNNNIKATIESDNILKVEDIGNSIGTSKVTVKYGEIERELYVTVVQMPAESSTPNSSTSIATNYGTIDVIWLDTDNNVIDKPNEPYLYNNSLEKVTWTKSGDTWTEDNTAQSTWYSYNAVSTRNANTNHTDDNNSSQWANAKNPADGSYFVWIPRYAYRITYYENETSTNPTGYYDGWGMWKAEDGSVIYALDSGVEIVNYNGNKYIVHPAFETNIDNGGWSTDLSGIWVAKYEMSQEKSTDSGTTWNTVNTFSYSIGNVLTKNAGNSDYLRAVSKPSTETNIVSSWTRITIGNMYINAYGYDRDKESHLMKNSEWGAVAYLTHSQYGRNGNEIDVNNSSDYLTGNGGGSTNQEEKAGITNYYNTIIGSKASTTGNIYGIYDMNGGHYESIASWDTLAEDTDDDISAYGSSFASKEGTSTKYATAYYNATGSDVGTKVYEVGKIGDATKEVYYGWFGDLSMFVNNSFPFFERGGAAGSRLQETSGIFNSAHYSGSYGNGTSFRTVLCIQ